MATITAAPTVVPEETPDRPGRPGAVAILIIVALMVAGGWLRFASLDRLAFWADEFPHAIAARSLLHDRDLSLPSGREYRRGLPQTLAVAASMRAFGENERAARLPSALVGLAAIPLVWLLTRRRFGDAAGLAAAAALAVTPLLVAHARSARFYAAFVLAYGVAAVTASHAIESRSRRAAIGAAIAFAAAMLLQVSAVMVLAPLALHAVWRWHRSAGEERRARGRVILFAGAALAAVVIVMMSIPSVRDSSLRLLREPVPGLRFGPDLNIGTFLKPFLVISGWAWIALVPLAILGIRRAGRWGGLFVLHLAAPAAFIAVLFKGTSTGGIGTRYLLHVIPFVAVFAGIGCAEGARRLATLLRRPGDRPALQLFAVAAAMLAVAGVFHVWAIPGEAHPTRLIPRPNWNAAGAVVRAQAQPGDALLSTSPLSMSWVAGRCGEWIREATAAEVYMVDGRDIYCATTLVPDLRSLESYLAAHPRGWLVADPRQWTRIVDPAATALIERIARRVDAGDPSVLVYRWDLSG